MRSILAFLGPHILIATQAHVATNPTRTPSDSALGPSQATKRDRTPSTMATNNDPKASRLTTRVSILISINPPSAPPCNVSLEILQLARSRDSQQDQVDRMHSLGWDFLESQRITQPPDSIKHCPDS